MFRHLIIHHVQFWFEIFSCEFLKTTFVYVVDTHVVQESNGDSKNGTCFIHVLDKVAYAPVEPNEKKITSQIVIDHT
jgi:hypothetical protein